MNPLFLPVIAFLLSLIATPLVRSLAIEKGWMAAPSEERWHSKPTALMGGIAIYMGMSIPLLFLADFGSLIVFIEKGVMDVPRPSMASVVWISATFLFILGLLDDFITIRPQTKLVGQILVAAFVSFLGFRLHWFTSLTLDTMVTLFWIVGISNAFNLIDNMDGLCAGTALIALISLSILFGSPGESTWTALILAAALAGFLVFNFNPASIFMGDSGSLLIGSSLAILTLNFTETQNITTISKLAVPILVLMVPIFDTTLVTVIRLLSGRKASVGGKDHTSHRLVLMGFNERNAVLVLYGIGAVSGVSAIFVSRADSLSSPAAIIPVVISILLMGIYLAQLRVYPEKEFSVLRDRAYTPVLVEITYKKQILLIILDLGMVAFAYYLSYRLRFSSNDFSFYFSVFLSSLPAVIACKLTAFFIMGIYRSMWGYMSTSDVFANIKASTVATLFSVVAVTFVYRFENFSKGIFLIDWLLTVAYLLGSRGSFKLFIDTMKRRTVSGDKVLIYGAGRGGELLLREILNNKSLNINPIGFIDDDNSKKGKKLQGYPILGSFKDAEHLCHKHAAAGMLVSFKRPESGFKDPIRQFCRSNGLFLKGFQIDLTDIE